MPTQDTQCLRCGSDANIQLHHVTPRANGGLDTDDNLEPLCQVCHDEIHTGVSDDDPARHTGEDFYDWANAYDGPPKEPWEVPYIDVRKQRRWLGKPPTERESNIGGRVLIELTDELYIDAEGARSYLEGGALDNTLLCSADVMFPDDYPPGIYPVGQSTAYAKEAGRTATVSFIEILSPADIEERWGFDPRELKAN